MPVPEQRDLEKTRDVLGRWLATKIDGATNVEVGPIAGPGSTGFSNETLIFDASWTVDGTSHTEGMVVRPKPVNHTVFMEQDFESQYRVLSALDAHTDVPVPPMKWYESDESFLGSPFFVMGKVDGRVPSDAPPYTMEGWLLDEATPDERRKLVESGLEAMAKIHNADWKALGFEFLSKPQYGKLGFEQQLRYYEKSYEWADPDRPMPTIAAAALEWVQAHAPAEDPEITVCWGDARINNQLFDKDFHVVAVLDWEMVTLADPMMDLAWWLFLDRHFHEGMPAPRMEGFPTREEMVAHYEKVSGRAARDIEFYEMFAGLRFAVIMVRIAKLLVDFEIMPPDNDIGENNAVTRVLADMLGLPQPGPGIPQMGAG